MYYLPEIAKIFRIEPMPRNCVQHQKGLSDDAFEQLYPDEEACRKAWFAWRWPEGFKCPRCAGSNYCEIRGRQLLQCRQCRHQTSLIAGTVLQGTKLPMRHRQFEQLRSRRCTQFGLSILTTTPQRPRR